jgi:uncharacterized protein YkwD
LVLDKSGDSVVNKNKRFAWEKADSMEIVNQLMAKQLDNTNSTVQMSSVMLMLQDQHDYDSGSDNASYHDSDGEVGCCDDDYVAGAQDSSALPTSSSPSDCTPSWLKRPMFADICSNHALVNAERQWVDPTLHPLKRSRELDDLARWHADTMAKEGTCAFHADPTVLCSKLAQQAKVRLGENVAKGKSIRELHGIMKKHPSNYANMMDARYTEMGMATAKSSNGDWYLCQIFRG